MASPSMNLGSEIEGIFLEVRERRSQGMIDEGGSLGDNMIRHQNVKDLSYGEDNVTVKANIEKMQARQAIYELGRMIRNECLGCRYKELSVEHDHMRATKLHTLSCGIGVHRGRSVCPEDRVRIPVENRAMIPMEVGMDKEFGSGMTTGPNANVYDRMDDFQRAQEEQHRLDIEKQRQRALRLELEKEEKELEEIASMDESFGSW